MKQYRHNWNLFLGIIAMMVCLFTQQAMAILPESADITNFYYPDHKDGEQNWGIDIDADKAIYFGNNNGLLRFNGNDWDLLYPGNIINTVRDVLCHEGRIYIAGDNLIGYWYCDDRGAFRYHTLFPQLGQCGLKGDTFWSIAHHNGIIYFHSFGNIIIYDISKDKLQRLLPNHHFMGMFPTEDGIILQDGDKNICLLKGDKLVPIISQSDLSNKQIRYFKKLKNANAYLIVTIDGEIWLKDKYGLRKNFVIHPVGNITMRIEGVDLCEERLAVGTLGDGVYVLNMKTHEVRHITNGLKDINIHEVKFSSHDLIWVATDAGVSTINLNPQKYLWATTEEIGIFFDAVEYKGLTYIATNRGMYKNDGMTTEKLQVRWYPLKFSTIKDELLVGTTTDLYKLEKSGNFSRLSSTNGVRQFEYTSDKGQEYLFLRGYSGVTSLRYTPSGWVFNSFVEGSADYDHIIAENIETLWVIDTEQGLQRLHLNEDKSQVISAENFTDIDGMNDFSRVNMVKILNNIYFITPKGLYYYDTRAKRFISEDKWCGNGLEVTMSSTFPAGRNSFWYATETGVSLFQLSEDSLVTEREHFLFSNPLIRYDKHFNFSHLSDSLSLVATSKGTLALTRSNSPVYDNSYLRVENCTYWDNDSLNYARIEASKIELPHSATDININISTGISNLDILFSYKVIGINDSWSKWQPFGKVQFAKLPSGIYNLVIRDNRDREIFLQLKILPPIWLRAWVIVLYVIVSIGILAAIIIFYMRKRDKQLKKDMEEVKWQHEQELQRISMESLKEKVSNQENELKNNMRFLTQKQELISEISAEIERQKKELGDRWPNKMYARLVKILESGASEKDKLLSFENYFVEIQKDFLDRLQHTHLELTQSELRLACLIRSNLHTKEIAAIMGIAVRSVELKKYRLKKKINLREEQSLTTFLFGI